MNKYIKGVLIMILGFIIYSFGNGVGGFIGDLMAIFGGVMSIYGIASMFMKKKSKAVDPTTTTRAQ